MNEFANRVALITGGGRGIGRALAVALAAEGAAVAAVDLDAEPLKELEKELAGKRFAWAVADVTDRDALCQTAADLQERLGPIDLLIANAGIGRETSALNFKAADVEAIVRVNLIGVANSIEAVLPGMIERRRGHLVAVSSVASYRGLPLLAGYSASKAGVNALLEGLRVELTPLGIGVTTVCPCWTRTDMTKDIEGPLPGILEAHETARHILWAIQRRRPFYAFPARAVWRLRFLAWLPWAWSDALVRAMIPGAKRQRPTADAGAPR